jgi:hypothetical protein
MTCDANAQCVACNARFGRQPRLLDPEHRNDRAAIRGAIHDLLYWVLTEEP